MRKNKKISGVSLVSMMIGMALSGFVITVLLEIFSTSKTNHKLVQNIVEMNESLRFATYLMTNIVGNAGFINPPTGVGKFPALNTVFTASSGQYVIPDLDQSGSGKFSVLLQGNPGIGADAFVVGCDGNTLNTTNQYRINFRIDTDINGMHLVCTQTRYNSVPVIDQGPTDYKLIDDLVERMWVRYGEDIDPITNGMSNRYIAQANVSDPLNIRAIRIALLLKSRDELSATTGTKTFNNILGESSLDYTTVADSKIYKLHTFTIPLIHLINS